MERDSGRISLAWEPSERFDATLVYEAQEYEGRGMPAEIISATPEAFGLSALAGFPQLETQFDRVNASSDSRVSDAFLEDSSVDRASLTAHWHVGEFVVTSQTAWSQSDSDASAGTDFLPGDYFFADHGNRSRRSEPGIAADVAFAGALPLCPWARTTARTTSSSPTPSSPITPALRH